MRYVDALRAVGLLAVGCLFVSAPPAHAEDETWGDKPAQEQKTKADDDVVWGGKGSVQSLTAEPSQTVAYGPAGCPIVVVDRNVWDVSRSQQLTELEGYVATRGLTSISADGQYFAMGSQSPNREETGATVWSLTTGKKVLTVPGVAKQYMDLILLAGDQYLLTSGRDRNAIDIWDLKTGHKIKTLPMPRGRYDNDHVAVTASGKYFACVVDDQAFVVQTITGRRVALLQSPTSSQTTPSRRSSDATFTFASMCGMAFSPDSKELALYTLRPGPRILCWDTKGRLVIDDAVAIGRESSSHHTFEWLPNGDGWLVNKAIIDRQTRRIVLAINSENPWEVRTHIVDQDHVIAPFGSLGKQLQVREIPWDKIHASMKAMQSPEQSIIGPTQPVSIEIAINQSRGDEAESRQALTEAIAKQLETYGIHVADNQPTIIRLAMVEKAGTTRKIMEKRTPFDMIGTDTGRTATDAEAQAQLQWLIRGSDTPLWSQSVSAISSTVYHEQINDQTIHKSMINSLIGRLKGLTLPYFVPKDNQLVALPLVIDG